MIIINTWKEIGFAKAQTGDPLFWRHYSVNLATYEVSE